MINSYDIGDTVRFTAVFKDVSAVEADPTTVLFKVKSPSGTITTYTYGGTGSNTAVIKDDVGNYHFDFTITDDGIWHYRWSGTGNLDAAEEATVLAKESAFF